jgi:DNA-binding response OmpR family regulator
MPAPLVYRFGPYRLDVPERRLAKDEDVLPLRLKVFDTLRVLVENAGRRLPLRPPRPLRLFSLATGKRKLV